MNTPTPFQYLEAENIQYQVFYHPRAETAAETAVMAQIPQNILAKVVVVELSDSSINQVTKDALVVIPSDCKVFPAELARALRCDQVSVASEAKTRQLFPDCEVGAEPPFGNLYGIEVYLARELFERFEITFKGGTHEQLIRMNTIDFCNHTQTQLLDRGYGKEELDIPFTEQITKPWRWI